jgi:hypothetical protein
VQCAPWNVQPGPNATRKLSALFALECAFHHKNFDSKLSYPPSLGKVYSWFPRVAFVRPHAGRGPTPRRAPPPPRRTPRLQRPSFDHMRAPSCRHGNGKPRRHGVHGHTQHGIEETATAIHIRFDRRFDASCKFLVHSILANALQVKGVLPRSTPSAGKWHGTSSHLRVSVLFVVGPQPLLLQANSATKTSETKTLRYCRKDLLEAFSNKFPGGCPGPVLSRCNSHRWSDGNCMELAASSSVDGFRNVGSRSPRTGRHPPALAPVCSASALYREVKHSGQLSCWRGARRRNAE